MLAKPLFPKPTRPPPLPDQVVNESSQNQVVADAVSNLKPKRFVKNESLSVVSRGPREMPWLANGTSQITSFSRSVLHGPREPNFKDSPLQPTSNHILSGTSRVENTENSSPESHTSPLPSHSPDMKPRKLGDTRPVSMLLGPRDLKPRSKPRPVSYANFRETIHSGEFVRIFTNQDGFTKHASTTPSDIKAVPLTMLEPKLHKGHSPMLAAASNGDIGMIKFHVEVLHQNINEARGRKGQTMLHKAAANGHNAILRYLIENGANVNAEDNLGASPLHCAAKAGSLFAIKLLCENGAMVDARSTNGATPIFDATMYCPEDLAKSTIKMLIQCGANLLATDATGQTAAHQMAQLNRGALLKHCLLSYPAARIHLSQDNLGNTPLHIACQHCRYDAISLLLEHADCLVPIKNKNRETPYDLADLQGKGIFCNFVTKVMTSSCSHSPGCLSLFDAIELGHLDCLEKVIDLWPDPNLTWQKGAGRGLHGVHVAVLYDQVNILQLLLSRGFSAHAVQNRLDSIPPPIFLAIARRHPNVQVVQCLLKAGANPNMFLPVVSKTSSITHTSLAFAMLLNAGMLPLHTIIRHPRASSALVRLLLEHGAKPDLLDSSGQSPLQLAAYAGKTDIAKLLIKAGATPNRLCQATGEAPILIAVKTQKLDLLDVLLRAKANVNLGQGLDVSPLCTAVKLSAADAVYRLLHAGANPNLNQYGVDPVLLLAVRANRLDIAISLLLYGADMSCLSLDEAIALYSAVSILHRSKS